jgi:hypothetical protein
MFLSPPLSPIVQCYASHSLRSISKNANKPVGVCLLATLIFWWSVYNYLPSHIAYLARRLSYYIHGDENAAIFGAVLAGWWGVVKRELGLVGRLYKGVWDDRFGWENTIENGNVKVDL